jgi:peptidyl-prolyl cis-trans isomerase B (cyclophilin B)
MPSAATLLVALLIALPWPVSPKPPAKAGQRGPTKPLAKAEPYKTPLTLAQMTGKQAVVATTQGTFVVDLRPDLAPNHVGYFMKLAGEGAYAGTLFHRIVKNGIIQGGDPLTKDPAKQAQYGTGGMGVLQAEHTAEPFERGSVGAAIRPGQPDSGGAQFFVCVSPQPALSGELTQFGRVSEGMDVVERISQLPSDAKGAPAERVAITSVTIRDIPPPEPVPFATETAEQLQQHTAVLETTLGNITIAFDARKAPEHVRNFLQLAQAGVFDGTAFHRVVRGFVAQTGAVNYRSAPLTEKQQKRVHNLQPEFNDTKHVKGIVSMARGDDPASANTSFFIVLADAPSLDGKYTVFGRVIDGLDVLDKIENAPVSGESPTTRIDLVKVRIVG